MTIRVAIVEDDERVRGSLAMLVGGSPGFELVGSYTDAESALENLPKTVPNVVLMDVQLPTRSGIECVRNLKPRLPRTELIILQAQSLSEKAGSGSTGYQPVPSGDSPDGMARASSANPDAGFISMVSPIPVGGSPTGTGGSPVPPNS